MVPVVLKVGKPAIEETYTSKFYFKASPNPVSKFLSLEFNNPVSQHITLRIYDNAGRTVKTIVDGVKNPGKLNLIVNAFDVHPGIYFVVLSTPRDRLSQKICLIR